MKILKSIMLGLALLAVCNIAGATNKSVDKPTKLEVLDVFINAAAHGKIAGLENVLDNDLEFNMKRGERTITVNKTQALDFYKASENIEQACKCSSSTIEDTDWYTIMKVEMKYDTYTRINVVTIKDTASGWKITKVDTSVVNNA
ncbi:MAG: hypothetical protein ABI367_16025 [Mucilaginibacter sp.]